ncbi:MAG: DNA polymerase III subunit beta [Deltaproteobacteria bacterium]|nr:DNA polymerase III subunit beta [Deltaproteobacteria bacterium]
MEFVIAKDEFIHGLSRVQSVIEKRTTLPILANALLETKGDALRITATDLEVGVKGLHEAKVLDAGSITINAKKLFEIVRELPAGEVAVKVAANNSVEITSGRSRFRILGLPDEEYPILPDYENEKFEEIPASAIADMFEMVSHAVGADETRPYLNGVFLETGTLGDKSTLRAVATDGHRLAMCEKELPEGCGLSVKPGVIVPRKAVAELRKLVEGEDGNILIKVSERNVIVRKGAVLYIIRLIEGNFPDFSSVIPKNNQRVVTCARDDLHAALRRVAIMAEELGRGVRFSLAKKLLEVSCDNPNLGEAKEELTVGYDGEEFQIGFNARYFLDALAIIKDEDASLSFSDQHSPVLLRAPSEAGYQEVIMPMRL